MNNSSIDIEKKINDWKNKLIDLSRRNRLLNFKPTRFSTLRIIDEIPAEVYKSFINDNDDFEFLPYNEESKENSIELYNIDFSEYNENDLEKKHKDLFLQTDLNENNLIKVLKNLYFKANQLIQEQGYNILYLALGFLEWYESETSDIPCKAPIIMLPVTLIRKSIYSKYQLSLADDEPFINLALQYKLKTDFNLKIDDINSSQENNFEPQLYFLELQEKIKSLKRWKITNEIYLGLFSFAKFSMFKDMENFTKVYAQNKTIQALAGICSLNDELYDQDTIKANEIDDKVNLLTSYQVLDADSSQQETIEAAKSEKQFVIQGPPGTGKSQTITNIISEFLACGKKVLFVSEKQAALNVVYKRLISVGLGKFCLEIHGHKVNKNHVITQIKEAYESENNQKIDVKDVRELIEIKSKLKIYVEELHKKIEFFGKTPYWFIGQLNNLKNIEIADFDISNLYSNNYEQYKNNITILENFKERIEQLGHPAKHVFWGTKISSCSEIDQQDISRKLLAIINLIDKTIKLLNIYNNITGQNLNSINEITKYIKTIKLLFSDHYMPESYLEIKDYKNFAAKTINVLNTINKFNSDKENLKKFCNDFLINTNELEDISYSLFAIKNFSEYSNLLANIIELINEFDILKEKIFSKYSMKILNENIAEINHSLKQNYNSFFNNKIITSDNIENCTFFGLNISLISEIEQQNNIKNLIEIINKLKEIINLNEKFNNITTQKINTFEEAVKYSAFFKNIDYYHIIPESYLEIKNYQYFNNQIINILNTINKFNSDKEKLSDFIDVFSITVDEIEIIVNSLHNLPNLNEYVESLSTVINNIAEFNLLKEKIFSKYSIEILNENITEIDNLLTKNYNSFFRIFKPGYHKLIKKINSFLINKQFSGDYITICDDIKLIVKYNELYQKIKNTSASIYIPLGKVWNFENTNILKIKEFIQRITELKQIKDLILLTPEKIFEPLEHLWNYEKSDTALISESLNWFAKYNENKLNKNDEMIFKKYIIDSKNITEQLKDVVSNISNKISEIKKSKDSIENLLKIDSKMFFSDFDNMSFNKILEIYENWYQILPNYYNLTGKMTKYFIDKDSISDYITLTKDCSMITRYKILEQKIKSVKEEIYIPLGKIWKYERTNTNSLKNFILEISNLKNLRDNIILTPIEITKNFESLWKNEKSDSSLIDKTIKWLIQYNQNRFISNDERIFRKYIINSQNIPVELKDIINELEVKLDEIKELKLVIENLLVIENDIIYPQFYTNSLELILKIYQNWHENIFQLTDWTRYQKVYQKCLVSGLGAFADRFISDSTYKFISSFKKTFLYHIFEEIKKTTPVLNDFDSFQHDKRVKNFKYIDKLQFDINKHRIIEKLHLLKPDQNWQGSRNSELGYLQRQFSLRRGRDSIRNLFSKIPNLIQQITPCFMMSPLSLAQYINPELFNFDLVIFDEASQITLENSLGAIIRGKQLIVVGDTKQLPPTSFFQKEANVDEEYSDDIDDLSAPDLSSILDQCLTIGMKIFTLKWHYRSKDESLIHFSNKYYYDNKLMTFPCPLRNDKKYGIEFRYIDNNYLSDNNQTTSINQIEAKAVAQAVFEHLKNNPDKSIGIGTFNERQQRNIITELDNLREKHPEFEKYFNNEENEAIFIKNLETIQGDERDIIFISVGYQKGSNGKLSMNFGPLNREGGERRLNVLITRAREKVIVFSSITGNDFDLSNTKSLGVYKFKEYLDFAKSNGNIQQLNQNINIFNAIDEDNIFEMSVFNELQNHGIRCIPQLGQAGYKIDFAILHPDNPSKFVLAVECDGASYHSLNTVRDRDRLRQEILENLGWNFHRIWSTDWFLNPRREMEKLKIAIENAIKPKKEEEVKPPKIELKFDQFTANNDEYYGIKSIPYKQYERLISKDSEYEDRYNILFKILKIEAPIHKRRICEKLSFLFGVTRVTTKVEQTINSMLNQLNCDKKIIIKNNFVYDYSMNLNFIRKRDELHEQFNFEHIAPEEIYNSIMIILKKEYTIFESEIYFKVAKFLGYNKTGVKIQNYIQEIIDNMLSKKYILKDNEGKYHEAEFLKNKNIEIKIDSL